MNIPEVENSIVNRVKDKVLQRVYTSEVPDNESPAMPYIVANFSYPTRTARDRHITNVRNDTRMGVATFRVVSTTDTSARAIANKLDSFLVGWEPTNSGQMIPEFNTQFSAAGATTQPTLYYRTMGFTFRTNLTWVNEPSAW